MPDGTFYKPFDTKQGENFEPSPGFHEGNAENTTNQQNKKPNNKRKKRNNRQRTPEDKSVRRSTKYDIREELPSTSNNESGLKALIKKPLKWLRGLGKK